MGVARRAHAPTAHQRLSHTGMHVRREQPHIEVLYGICFWYRYYRIIIYGVTNVAAHTWD